MCIAWDWKEEEERKKTNTGVKDRLKGLETAKEKN